MNALIISAIMGVLMMFSGILLKQKSTVRGLAFIGLLVAIILNVMEGYGFHLFRINVTGMMNFDKFSLVFNTIAMSCTLIFFLLSAKEMVEDKPLLPISISQLLPVQIFHSNQYPWPLGSC